MHSVGNSTELINQVVAISVAFDLCFIAFFSICLDHYSIEIFSLLEACSRVVEMALPSKIHVQLCSSGYK